MTENKKIMVVDDEPTNLLLIEETLLSGDYDVSSYELPLKAKDEIDTVNPDIIVLDIAMPQMDGYELCEWIKNESEYADVPVIFVTAKDTVEERVKGYEVGCHDYIVKPFKPTELLSKIKVTVDTIEAKNSLKEEVDNVWATAMEAMSSAGEFGETLQFLDKSISCESYEELAELVFAVTSSLDLSCSIQFRHNNGVSNFCAGGICSPNELELLSKAANKGRLFEIGARLFVNFEHVTLFVKNMPIDNPEAKGRFQDLLPIMINGANAKVLAIESAISLRKKRLGLRRAVAQTHDSLLEVQEKLNNQKEKADILLGRLIQEMEAGFLSIDLSYDQQEYMIKLLEDKKTEVTALYDQGLALDSIFNKIIVNLNDVIKEK